MAIANPRIHIICGICGNKDMLTFRIDRDEKRDVEDNIVGDEVMISCGNCGSLTGLDEVIEEK